MRKGFLIFMQNIERKSKMIGLAFDRPFVHLKQTTWVCLDISKKLLLGLSFHSILFSSKAALSVHW